LSQGLKNCISKFLEEIKKKIVWDGAAVAIEVGFRPGQIVEKNRDIIVVSGNEIVME